jgi:hypothetical protein
MTENEEEEGICTSIYNLTTFFTVEISEIGVVVFWMYRVLQLDYGFSVLYVSASNLQHRQESINETSHHDNVLKIGRVFSRCMSPRISVLPEHPNLPRRIIWKIVRSIDLDEQSSPKF